MNPLNIKELPHDEGALSFCMGLDSAIGALMHVALDLLEGLIPFIPETKLLEFRRVGSGVCVIFLTHTFIVA